MRSEIHQSNIVMASVDDLPEEARKALEDRRKAAEERRKAMEEHLKSLEEQETNDYLACFKKD